MDSLQHGKRYPKNSTDKAMKKTLNPNPRFIPVLLSRRRDANDSASFLCNSSNFTLLAEGPERFKRSFIPSMLFSQ